MAESIVCPVCGEPNPADMEFCRNCQSRLRPLTGALKSENAPIQPGELPTKKVTSELEPLLPQWLRDARQQARESAAEDRVRADKEEKEIPEPSGSDLLAGLASKGREDEEEVPEWLASITGAQSKKKKSLPEDGQAKWVELGRSAEAQESPLDTAIQSPKAAEHQKDELTDWFKQAAAAPDTGESRMPPAPTDFGPYQIPQENQAPAQPVQPAEAEDLSWLKSLDAASGSEHTEQPAMPQPPLPADVPDWLKTLQAEQAPVLPPREGESVLPPASPVPDWLKSFGEESPAPPTSETPIAEQLPFRQQLPEWLKEGERAETSSIPPASTPDEESFPIELPDWLSTLGSSGQSAQEEAKPAPPVFETQPLPTPTPSPSAPLPDWVASLRSEAETSKSEQPSQTPSSELPDWVSTLRSQVEVPKVEEAPGPPEIEPEKPAEQPVSTERAFSDDALAGHDVDAVFASMQTPDWLSAVLPAAPTPQEGVPAGAPEEEAIGPAELPSWVQAMRPVESAMAGTPGSTEEASTEEGGPLAGLHGVLPIVPGAVMPSSKPKPHSIKLDASEQQQSHAALLEQILAAETSPIPMKSAGAVLRSQQLLRWAISALLLVLLGGAVFGRTQLFPLPSGVPNETVAAIQAVEAVPADAPVLVVFDYQAATVGEMEATGASLLDHMLLLKHPRLVLLSTSPTGPALAERFMSTTLASRAYARNVQYVDLGYLPGGLAGVYNFAQNPSGTVPLDVDAKPVWQSPILAPVQRFADFAAIIVLTDSVESGRTWVEQTQATRGKNAMVLVASAQAGPILLPYVDSGQVNGMVSGIYGAVGAEQQNAGLPGLVRQYWDGYSLGLYLAVMLIVLGGLWNVWLGLRDRRASAVG